MVDLALDFLRARLAAVTPERPPFLSLRYLGASFTVVVHSAGIADELPRFLLPHSQGPAEPGAWTLHLLNEADVPGGTGFVPFARAGHLMAWEESSGALTVTDSQARVRWHVLRRGTHPRRFTQDVYCGIRRLGLSGLPAAVLLHAASVRVHGSTLLFLGPKGSGKTVTTHHLMLAEQAELVASDKVCVWAAGGSWHAAGLIESVRVEPGDGPLLSAPRLTALMDAARAEASDATKVIGTKVSFSPAHFASLAGVSVLPVARPDALVLISPTEQQRPLERLAPGEVRRMLAAHVLDDRGIDGERTMGEAQELAPVLDALSEACPAWSLRSRPELSTLAETLAPILRDVR
jgi:hypothetical protein